MANQEHLDILEQGVDIWNQWRTEHPEIRPDLTWAYCREADLHSVNLSGANLAYAVFVGADLHSANFCKADLHGVNLRQANLRQANLIEADLRGATLVETDFREATLTDCLIYGISVWKVQLAGATQDSLVITPEDEPTITVDNLKIAQFIYLLLNNVEIREAIDT